MSHPQWQQDPYTPQPVTSWPPQDPYQTGSQQYGPVVPYQDRPAYPPAAYPQGYAPTAPGQQWPGQYGHPQQIHMHVAMHNNQTVNVGYRRPMRHGWHIFWCVMTGGLWLFVYIPLLLARRGK